jgi:alkanesulfonate monooxygenase SsuD/methylene tetrahydromethanopterin reductase-like flavin-dependent oxidoreductase (luciferase family)
MSAPATRTRPPAIALLVRGGHAAGRHGAMVEEAVLAEALGFDAVWLGVPPLGDAALAAPPVVLAAIAARTRHVRLGAAVAPLSALDPLRVAEDYATLDGISDGRVELAAACGAGVAAAGACGQAHDESGPRFRESVLLLRRLWSESEVSWRGSFRTPLDGVTIAPRPLQRPHPPLWIADDGTPGSLELAAELGLPLLLPSALAAPARVTRYRALAAAAGHDPGALRVGACHEVGLLPDSGCEAADRLLAWREALRLDLAILRVDDGRLPPAAARALLERFAAQIR